MSRAVIVLAFTAATAAGQAPVSLREAVAPGDLTRVEIALKVGGKLRVQRGGQTDAIPLVAQATVAFTERVETVGADGRAGGLVRHYTEARSASDVGLEREVRQLAADRRIIAVAPGAGPFAPAGPLTREELELVGEHLDPAALPALLPPTPVSPGATWPVPPDAARRLLHFDTLVKSDVTAKLDRLNDEAATLTVSGVASGSELGAAASVKVLATVTFDRRVNRVCRVEWSQDDTRSQGPASPRADLTATVTLTRTPLAVEPAELKGVSAGAGPVGAALMLRYADPQGRYQFAHPREWHVVGRTADHLTLRLVEAGEFVAQATVTAWKPAAAGSHLPVAEFQALLAKLPGWVPARVTTQGELPTDAGRWLYRVAARGTQDGLAVAQTFYLLAGPRGDQVAVTIVARPEAIGKLGTRDAELVNGVEFPRRN